MNRNDKGPEAYATPRPWLNQDYGENCEQKDSMDGNFDDSTIVVHIF
jgi:hypothetical protein